MKLKDIVVKLNLEVLAGNKSLELEINGGYVSDILSDVMAKTEKGDLWVTNQAHQNVIALVYFKRMAGVIIADGIDPEPEALEKAVEHNIPLLKTQLCAFEVVGQLYQLGIRGKN